MMPFSKSEQNGLSELLLTEENTAALMQLSKSLVKNVITVSSAEEAFNIIMTHGNSAATILNKKAMTKEILFKYLNARQVPVDLNITKSGLVSKTLEYWSTSTSQQQLLKNCDKNPSVSEVAIAFADWFFSKYNSNLLVEADFYPDADMTQRILANDGSEENKCNDAATVITLLNGKKAQFGFYFNLNTTESGVQGRQDVHGMLLVLTCGTLHTTETCVGVFECMFGLLRDPFHQNAWKIKTIRSLWRSEMAANMPTLNESETLREALAITEISEHG